MLPLDGRGVPELERSVKSIEGGVETVVNIHIHANRLLV